MGGWDDLGPDTCGYSSGSVVLEGGGIVVTGIGHSDEAAGLPLHLYSPQGEFVRSFGAEPAIVGNWDDPFVQFHRSIASSADGGLWSGHYIRYIVEKWDSAGRLEQRFNWSTSWFPDDQTPVFAPQSPDDTPSTVLRGLREDERGRLWILTNIPAPNWFEQLDVRTEATGKQVYRVPSPPSKLWWSRIEVRDARSGELVARVDHPIAIRGILDSGVAWSDDLVDGVPQIRLWTLVLSPAAGKVPS
jgi:hypothetical protein